MPTITGAFDVTLGEPNADFSAGTPFAAMTLTKQYHGALKATAKGMMLAGRTAQPGSAGYVAMEEVSGSLDGKEGSFMLQHSGTMNKGDQSLSVTVVPDSGTAGLEGLSGSLAIRIEGGKHFYDFDYSV